MEGISEVSLYLPSSHEMGICRLLDADFAVIFLHFQPVLLWTKLQKPSNAEKLVVLVEPCTALSPRATCMLETPKRFLIG